MINLTKSSYLIKKTKGIYMKIRYSWKQFFSWTLLPIIAIAYITSAHFRQIEGGRYFYLIFSLIVFLFALMNCCRFFFGYYIFIDNNEIKIFVGPGGIYKRMKIDAIKTMNAERYWIT